MTTVCVVALVLVPVLALLAGMGWGAAFTLERLRPEQIAKRVEQHAYRTMREMQAVHDSTLRAVIPVAARRSDGAHG